MESTAERPNLWSLYCLWRKDNDTETEAKGDMAPSSPKQFRTCSVPTSPVEHAVKRLYNHWDLFTASSGSHGMESTARVGEGLSMKTIDPPPLSQENEPVVLQQTRN